MKRGLCTLLLLGGLLHGFAQRNIELLSRLQYNFRLSNIWGWTAPDSTEYALVGTQQGVSIVSLKDPRNPKEVASVLGSSSLWREIKTYGNHAYVVTDQSNTNDGLLIIDLSKLPDSVSSVNWRPEIPGLGTLGRCHTLFIDEKGICYLNGSQLNSGGVIMADVATNPQAPIYLGKGAPIYIHDGYARRDTLYAGEIYQGRVAVYDVKDKNNVKLLATQRTPSLFTHNTWLSDNGKFLFTTDEVNNAPIAAYNISDLNDIKEVAQFRRAETLNRGVVPHNVLVKGDFLVTAYYTDGVNIIDASRPNTLIEVGNYDTYPGADGGFNGAWGAYPYFPSGNIVVSDITNGLYILKPTYVKAAFLEGKVTNANNGQALSGVKVTVQSNQPNEKATDLSGNYQTGQALAGTFNVVFSKPGFESKTLSATLQNGQVTILNTSLVPLITYAVSGRAIQTPNNAGVPYARVLVSNDIFNFETSADTNGNFSLQSVPAGTYDLYVGAWGFRQKLERNIIIDNNKTITLAIERGYQDDFVVDLGWSNITEGPIGSTTGGWVRDVPIGTFLNGAAVNPDADIPTDLGKACYMTGNGGGAVGDDDVDNGTMRLLSPPMDISTYQNPVLSYYLWFYNGGGSSPANDTLSVYLSNGTQTVLLEKVSSSGSTWRPKSVFRIKDKIALSKNMAIRFETSDLPPNLHLVEAAVDAFLVEESNATPITTSLNTAFRIAAFPNPFTDQLTIQYELPVEHNNGKLFIYNALGQILQQIPVSNNPGSLLLGEQWASGIYFLQVKTDRSSAILKVIKH